MAGGTLSEGDESEEENVEKLQGIIRFFILDFWGGFCFLLPSLLTSSGLTLSVSAPCMRRTCSALARFLFHENKICLHLFLQFR